MVGQSLDVAVLALIEALSTAEVTALIWSGDPLVCASAPEHEMAKPNPIAIAACARRAGRCNWDLVSGEKRRAESLRGKGIIHPSQRSLADLPRCYAGEKDGVNQRPSRKSKRENLYRHVFAKRNTKRVRAAPQHRTAHRDPKFDTPSSIGCSADVVQRQLLASVF